MKVVTLKDISIVPAEGAAEQTEGWTGPVSRTCQTIIQPGESADYTLFTPESGNPSGL